MVACACGGLCLWWPVPVVACTVMNSGYEDSDSQCYRLSKKMTGNTALDHHDHPFNLVVIVMLVEVGPLMLNMIIQRLNLIQL